MNMVKKYYVFFILFLSVLFVFAYGSGSVNVSNMPTKQLDFRPISSPLRSNDLKIQEKLKPTNEVVYHSQTSTSSVKDETSLIDFLKTIETTISESEFTTSGYTLDKKYSSPVEYTSTEKKILSSKAEEYETSTNDFTSSNKDETSQIHINIISETSTDFSKNIETTFDSESITSGYISDEKYSTSEEYTSTEKNELSSKVEKYETSTNDFTSSIKDETSQIHINLKAFESKSTTSKYTSDEKYSSSEKYTSTEKIKLSSKAEEYETSTNDFTSSIKDETSQIQINIKNETSTDFSKNIDTTFDSESITSGYTSDEKYSSPEEYTSTEKKYLSSKAEEYETTNSNFTNNYKDYTTDTTKNILPNRIESTTINICEIAEITHIDVFPNPFSLNITWINSVNLNCEFIYGIQSSKEMFQFNTTDSFIFINYLNACEYYEGTVSILYNENVIDRKTFSATTSEAVDPVEQLKFQVIESLLHISWLPSIRTTSCIKYYNWKHFQDEKLVEEQNVNSINVTISQPDGCLNNTFSVLAAINDYVLSSPQNVTYMDIIVNDPPIFVTAKMGSNSAITKWMFTKICKPQSFLVNFTSDNEHFSVIENTIQIENKEIIAVVDGLLAFTNYSFYGAIKNEIKEIKWSDISPTFQTKEMEPDPPENLSIKQDKSDFLIISWEKPHKWNGRPISYLLNITFIQFNYTSISGCPNNSHEIISIEIFDYNINKYSYMDFVEPASLYTISIHAKSSGGIGRPTEKNIITNEKVPDKPNVTLHFEEISLKNVYNVTLHVEWKTPCRVNGNVSHYAIQLSTCDNNNDNEYYIIPITSSIKYSYSFKNLLPDSCYNFIVQLHLQSKYSRTLLNVTSPAGIPDIVETVDIPIPTATLDNPETTANVYITNNIFNSTMGEIIYYAIIVAQKGCEEKPTSDFYSVESLDDWPKVEGNELCIEKSKAYQATKIKWNPFLKGRTNTADSKMFTLGTEKNCTSDICNRPLTPNTNYSIKIRGFTRKGFSDTQLIYFTTASFVDVFQLGLILGLIFGILAIAFIIAAALFYTKGKLNFTGWPRMESTSNISPAPLPVPLKKFKTHYTKMIENSGKIKNEFQLLSTISSDVTLSTKTAMLPINRKKNRYINILPYDQTRVKLNDTSITASDYINASYIKGYSENIEYIATQGPTESTSAAFWQMIIEQNVKLIVMLTQFVESGKEKCYKYFPDLNNSHNYLNVITVECIDEKLLPNFNRRTFKITKGKEVKTIIHLQFNLWPDFGVPHELDYIIEFNKKIKEIKLRKSFLVVMHCSAGVGRTGTLIAVDILMQTIRDKRKVDIFGTVLNLRKQRMNMVQSEIQYEFLYQCVNFLLSDNSRTLRSSSHSHSKLQLDQIEESQITESNMLPFKF